MPAESAGTQGLVVRELCFPNCRGGEVSEIAFSADGAHLITGTKDFAVRVWGTYSGKVELLAPPLAGSNDDGGYHAGKLSCDVVFNTVRGLLMPAGSATGGIIVWDCEEGGRRTAELRNNGHEYACSVAHLAAYPDGRYFVSADRTTMKVWSADDFKCKRTIRSAFDVSILMVSAQCRFIFCAGENYAKRGVIAVWHGSKRGEVCVGYGRTEAEPLRLLTGHGKHIRSLYAPDSPDVLVTTALDGMAKVWHIPTGTCTRTIWSKGGLGSPLSLAALVNRGAWLLTSCDDGSLQVWGIETGRCLVTLANASSANTAPTTRLAVSRCGGLVALATGARVQVLDFDKLADHSKARRPGEPGAYLRHALRFVTLPTRR